MAKLIKAYKENFTIVDNEIFKDQRLSYKELGLLCQMLSLPNNWNFSVAGLAVIHKDGTDSIKAGIKKLEEYGYLTRKQARDDRGVFSGHNYLIYQNPKENPDYESSGDSMTEKEPLVENPLTDNPPADNPSTGNPSSANPPTGKPTAGKQAQYSTKESSTQESSTNQSITELLSMYESDSEADTNKYSEEEIMGWDDDEFYRHLTKSENDAFLRLFEASIRGEIRSSKSSLIEYFKKMKARGWRDYSNRRIKNIEGYVRSNFDLYTENQKYRRNRREDIIPVYDTSKNPSFNEEEFNRRMEERKKEDDEE